MRHAYQSTIQSNKFPSNVAAGCETSRTQGQPNFCTRGASSTSNLLQPLLYFVRGFGRYGTITQPLIMCDTFTVRMATPHSSMRTIYLVCILQPHLKNNFPSYSSSLCISKRSLEISWMLSSCLRDGLLQIQISLQHTGYYSWCQIYITFGCTLLWLILRFHTIGWHHNEDTTSPPIRNRGPFCCNLHCSATANLRERRPMHSTCVTSGTEYYPRTEP
jgi:hypothetical protein